MLPLALLAGFLGAGKTTFLTAYARRRAGRGTVFLVNEFAATDVDTPLLSGASPDCIGISGGSIFCRCKVTDFIRELSGLRGRFPHATGVIVEASGMADPSAARSLLDDSGLDRSFSYRGTVTLVDPGTLPKILDTLPAAERQVAAADAVVVSKSDLHDAAALAACEALVRGINPGVRLLRAVRGDCDLDPLALASPRWVDGEVAPCRDPLLVAIDVPCAGTIDVERLARDLAGLGGALHRAKGFAAGPDGWRLLDWSAGRMSITSQAGPPGLALIVAPAAAEAARAIAAAVAAGAYHA